MPSKRISIKREPGEYFWACNLDTLGQYSISRYCVQAVKLLQRGLVYTTQNCFGMEIPFTSSQVFTSYDKALTGVKKEIKKKLAKNADTYAAYAKQCQQNLEELEKAAAKEKEEENA